MSSQHSVQEGHTAIQEEQEQTSTAPEADPLVPRDSDQNPDISIILPTLNEEEGIAECISQIRTALRELNTRGEIIVSDSSTDRTPEIARQHGAIVVVPDEMGYGAAYKHGFRHARGEYIAIGDADTTYDFGELPKLYKLVAEGDADMALGSRLEGNIEPGAMPALHRYVGNPLLTRFLNMFYNAGVSDAHSGFRVFSRSALDQLELRSDGMEFASEMIMEASAKNLNIEERPITYHKRVGEATLESFQDGWRHVRFMLLNAPRYLFLVPGIVLGIIGAFVMTAAMLEIPMAGTTLGVRSMIAGGLLVVAGHQVVSFSVFASGTTDPIQEPSDFLTNWFTKHVTIERGIVIGLIPIMIGSVYLVFILYIWITRGYNSLPLATHDVAAFVLIILGIQTIFSSFFVGMLQNDILCKTTEKQR